MTDIAPIGGFKPLAGITPVSTAKPGANDFQSALTQAMDRANTRLTDADRAVEDLAAGRAESAHQVMIHLEEANLTLQWAVQIRNRALEAYNDILRMPL